MPNPAFKDWAAEAEERLLDAAIRLGSTSGWNGQLVQRAGRECGLSGADVELLLPKGASDLSALLSRRHDRRALEALSHIDPEGLKVRERIHAAVEARIDAAMEDEAAMKASTAYLALPARMPLALRLGWETADVLWRWAGDAATDENHYSKRAILSAVLVTTLAARLAGGHDQARRHLSARIDQVMAFEKWKAKAPNPADWSKIAAAFLGRMRYGARGEALGQGEAPPAP